MRKAGIGSNTVQLELDRSVHASANLYSGVTREFRSPRSESVAPSLRLILGSDSKLTRIVRSCVIPVTSLSNSELILIHVTENDTAVQVRLSAVNSDILLSVVTFSKVGHSLRLPGKDAAFDWSELNLETVGFAVWIVWMARGMMLGKMTGRRSTTSLTSLGLREGRLGLTHSKSQSTQEEARRRQPEGDQFKEGIPRNPSGEIFTKDCSDKFAESMDISLDHDLECTDFMDGDVMILPVPDRIAIGICGAVMEVRDCCIEHDIALWCTPPRLPGTGMSHCLESSYKLVACMIDAAYRAWEALPNSLCKIFDIIFSGITAITDALLYGGVTEFICMGLGEAQAPKDGRNSKSCLCGGTTPTIAGSPCRDMCAERGKFASCYPCKWKCEFANGKPVSKKWDSDPTGRQACCPGSTRQCIGDCNPNDLSKCPNCFNCYSECKRDPATGRREKVVIRGDGVPCCKGTPLNSDPCAIGGVKQ